MNAKQSICSITATISSLRPSQDDRWFQLALTTEQWNGAFLPGQFLNLRIQRLNLRSRSLSPEEKLLRQDKRPPFLRRPFSIYKTEHNNTTGITTIHLLIAKLGRGTELLRHFKAGTELELLTPLGNGFPLDLHKEIDELYLIGGGIGIAPLLELGRYYRSKGVRVSLFFGIQQLQTSLHIITDTHHNLMDAGCADMFFPATDRKTEGVYQGFVTNLFAREYLENPQFSPKRKVVMACGPEPMFVSLKALLQKYHLEGYFSLENYMACGIGSCMGCVAEVRECDGGEESGSFYARSCTEGPVFSAGLLKQV